ncbi:protein NONRESPONDING TO OXYLIPINS 2, mitochondrial isoform X1 [Salvia hispanica]|uniref:Protein NONRESPONDING TO OXYLIPINS 2, mitochondrial isoform X1 n=1 Tax=Salvia divinorum TaxID=28513 RepID=A0ABD1HLJ7_SALDI|nr:protein NONRESPONDING TO OXYLIPINS 2, mitochondrial isoform X1 [Salvia hispanica]
MASRCRTISRPAMSFLKSSFSKPSSTPMFSAQSPRLSPSPFSSPLPQMAMLQSLLPLHSALSSARLTSCLGIDTKGCRSLSQGMLSSANPGV